LNCIARFPPNIALSIFLQIDRQCCHLIANISLNYTFTVYSSHQINIPPASRVYF
jgi:hypothetical protein